MLSQILVVVNWHFLIQQARFSTKFWPRNMLSNDKRKSQIKNSKFFKIFENEFWVSTDNIKYFHTVTNRIKPSQSGPVFDAESCLIIKIAFVDNQDCQPGLSRNKFIYDFPKSRCGHRSLWLSIDIFLFNRRDSAPNSDQEKCFQMTKEKIK